MKNHESGDTTTETDDYVSGNRDGVAVSVTLIEEMDVSREIIFENEKDKMLKQVKKLSGVQDESVCDTITSDEYSLVEIDYNIKKNNKLYPCITLIKLDDLSEGFYLKPVITINSTNTNANTKEVLKIVI